MAIPVQQHQFALQSNTNQHYPITTTATIITNIPRTKKISATYLNEYKSINELELYYSNLVTDVLETTINEILQNAPETYLTIHELQYIGRDYCRTSVRDFMQVLKYQLDTKVIKNNLLTSIRSLIEDSYDKENIIQLNTHLSTQLGSILDTDELSHRVVQSFYRYHTRQSNRRVISRVWRLLSDKKWLQTIQHERNESMALEAWLNSWLMDIRYALKSEFDAKIYSLSI